MSRLTVATSTPTALAICHEANQKRSEAIIDRPRDEDGTLKQSSSGTSCARTGYKKGQVAKASASKTNRGAVARGVLGAVHAAKDYLDAELAKAESWDTSDKNIRGLFDSQKAFETSKGMGVGRDTILKFLGGNWKLL